MTIFDDLPRTDFPRHINSWAEDDRSFPVLPNVGIIKDATKIGWDPCAPRPASRRSKA
jgi:hypothetical protein